MSNRAKTGRNACYPFRRFRSVLSPHVNHVNPWRSTSCLSSQFCIDVVFQLEHFSREHIFNLTYESRVK